MADDCDKQIALEPCATVTRAVCVRKLGDACSRNALAVRACVDGRRGPTEVIYELDGDTLMAGYTSADIVACPVEVRFCMQDGEQGGGGGGGGGGGDATALNQTLQIALQNDQIDEATETNTRIGLRNEAAAATDNSVSGLNGLIKRLLAKFTTQFPAALGSQTGAASLGVALSTEDATTQTTISANTGNTATNTSAISGKLPATLGQKTSALSLAVVQASDATTPNLAVATSITVVNAATTNTASAAVTTIPKGVRTWFGYGTTSAGAGSCTLTVEGSMDGSQWKTIGTMTLTLATTITTDTNTDSFTDQSSFVQYRGRTAGITGTNAAVTLKVGV